MNMSLFDVEPDRPTVQPGPCVHPPESQILNRNLFTGSFDLVCSQCNATLAEDYQK